MKVLFTGASSAPGERVARRLLNDPDYSEIWCGVHRREPNIVHPRLRTFPLELNGNLQLDVPASIDLVIHFASLTHAQNEQAYWEVNLRGTMRLVEQVRLLGCRRFCYVSTRCATPGSGAYGESKLASELELQKLDWESLLIVRPAEIYGGQATEGIDGFIRMAARFHLAPMLWGHRGIQFAPIHIDDFVNQTYLLLTGLKPGTSMVELTGPETLSGVDLALRLASRYKALPIPLWWPALSIMLQALSSVGGQLTAPDQMARLVGPKTALCATHEFSSNLIRFPG